MFFGARGRNCFPNYYLIQPQQWMAEKKKKDKETTWVER